MMVAGEQRLSNVLGCAGNTCVKTACDLDMPAERYDVKKLYSFHFSEVAGDEGPFWCVCWMSFMSRK